MANTKQTKASPGGTEETSSASLRAGSGCQDSGGEQSPKCVDSGREQDRYLPVANILRIMKKGLPSNAKIAKDAKDTMQLCVSEFISFITSEASEKCLKEKRKTINGDDLLLAIATLGFEDFIEPLKDFLQKYREFEAAEDARREAGGSHPSTSRTMEHQNACQPVPQQISLTQGMNFVNPQVPQQGPLGQGMDFLNPQVPQQGSLMQGMDFLNPQIPQQDPLVQNMDFLNPEALPPLDGDWRAYDPFSKPSKESDGWKVDESLWCMLKTFQTLFQRVV